MPTRLLRRFRFPHLLCTALALAAGAAAPAAGETIELDVLVVHTPAVTTQFGGEAGTAAHVTNAVETANTSFADSEIPVLLNLVAVEEIDYVESSTSMNEDLERITGQDGGFVDEDLIDEVHGLRDAHGADLVSLFRDGPVDGVAGLAWLGNPNSPNPDFGYSVVSAQSASSNLVFAHELGHNLSSAHAHNESGDDPELPYARGHRFTAGGTDYRTIMAISLGYSRIGRFANPDVFFEGEPTGVPAGITGQEADNAKAFGLMGPETRAYRRTQTDQPTFLRPSLGETIVAGDSARLNAFVRGFPPLEVQWYAGPVGDTSNPVNSTEEERERGGTDTFIETPALSHGQSYWLELTNPNATKESDNVQVVVLPSAPGPRGTLIGQGQFDNAFNVDIELWQEVFPTQSYIDTIEVELARSGNPAPVRLRFSEVDGPVLAERTVTAGEVSSLPTRTSVPLEVRQFVAPGQTFRISVIPDDNLGGSDLFIWAYGENAVDPGAGIGEINASNENDLAFMFGLRGTESWSYHTWRRAENIPAAKGRPTDAAGDDGLPNLARYALGFGAGEARSTIAPKTDAIREVSGNEVLPFEFSVRRDAPDVDVRVETSADLASWSELGGAHIEFLETVDGKRDVFEARVPVSGEPTRFVRVRVVNPPD